MLCLLCGAVYSALLYKQSLKKTWHKVLAVLRLISVSLICFFLLNPVLVQWLSTEQKPKVLMVMDVSESVPAQGGLPKNFLTDWQNMPEQLGDQYEVEYLNLGTNIASQDSIKFNAKRTHLSAMFDYINHDYLLI